MQRHFKDRASWRAWLARNHSDCPEIWLVFFKKHTGKKSISYDDAVEEALCFGWIDSLIKRLDDDRYLRKFTPRTDTSKWSAANLARIRKLTKAGRMTEAGLAKVLPDAKPQPAAASKPFEVPQFLADALAAHPVAKRNFDLLAPSYRRHYIGWLSSAKRPETRARRLDEAISLLKAGKKLGMK